MCVCVCVGGYYIDVHYIDDTVQKCVCGVWGGGREGQTLVLGYVSLIVCLWEEGGRGLINMKLKNCLAVYPFSSSATSFSSSLLLLLVCWFCLWCTLI